MAGIGCGLNGSTQHLYKTAPLGFRSRGSYKAAQSAGAATDAGERAGSSKNRFAPGTVVWTGDPGCRVDQVASVPTDWNSTFL